MDCARELIGTLFLWKGVGGVVVETEAYAAEGDEACHTFTRPSTRQFVSEHPPGTSYVYLNYGMYWLVNVLVKSSLGDGFVLLRALEPKRGLKQMRTRRGKHRLTDLCSGPGKLSMALAMDGSHHGLPLAGSFHPCAADDPLVEIESGPRIGITRSVRRPWRFTAKGNPHISVRLPDRRLRSGGGLGRGAARLQRPHRLSSG